ncbi:tRNA(Arg) A34 adenosine deaminase TadA [Ancylobacter sp. 3268]|uniref:nucleoside deaminase n=1 Tax=Ancylobacter sp. 3268 TaxID=2817752 RepID=UPI0028548740|nr:nucleoside deaminase [Ancylobacter sp. 3268]MDR6951217.1 tRNA(Arg) A34 adenosine deaminase TadA [Ancylobacter sp. 3268]
MSTPELFMRRAIEISRDKMRADGSAPFGCVIVKDGEIVGEGVNNVVNNHDATSHGEVEAIRDAGRRLRTWDLSGCDLYTTCEPCEMCVASMFWAKISRMYYANTLKDCTEVGFDLEPLTRAVRADLHDRALPAERLLAAEAREVLDEWVASPGFNAFQ